MVFIAQFSIYLVNFLKTLVISNIALSYLPCILVVVGKVKYHNYFKVKKEEKFKKKDHKIDFDKITKS